MHHLQIRLEPQLGAKRRAECPIQTRRDLLAASQARDQHHLRAKRLDGNNGHVERRMACVRGIAVEVLRANSENDPSPGMGSKAGLQARRNRNPRSRKIDRW